MSSNAPFTTIAAFGLWIVGDREKRNGSNALQMQTSRKRGAYSEFALSRLRDNVRHQ